MQAGGVKTPAMAAEVQRETRLGVEGDGEVGIGGDGTQDSERGGLLLYACVLYQ